MIRRPPRSTRTDPLFPYTTPLPISSFSLAMPLAEAMRLSANYGYTETTRHAVDRSEEHTSELQSLMRISYAVFCWKKKIVGHGTRSVQSKDTLEKNKHLYESKNILHNK